MRSLLTCSVLWFSILASAASADPFNKPGYLISDGVRWADDVASLVRGPMNIVNPSLGNVSAGLGSNSLGPATGSISDTVSLGDGGAITLSFGLPLLDGLGDDLAVFENGFFSVDGLFAELAFVEVSSNGIDFARFDSATLNTTPVSAFGTLQPGDYAGLAGDQPAGLGTGFDLSALAGHALVGGGQLDLSQVRYVRVVDIVGDGSTTDTAGSPLYDAYATPFATGGFDLDGIAALQAPAVPLSPSVMWLACLLMAVIGHREIRRIATVGGLAMTVIGLSVSPASAVTATFDDAASGMGLGSNSYYNGADEAGGFSSGGATFANTYDTQFSSWSGFSLSNTTDTTTPGFLNQYSARPGSGAAGTVAYGVGYYSEFVGAAATVSFPAAVNLEQAYITNTTFAYLHMLNGDSFGGPFGGPSGDEPDVFTLTIEGFDASSTSVGSIDVILGDYSATPNAGDFIIDVWTLVDLSSLENVRSIDFTMDSTDVAGGFTSTPTYFGIDEFSFAAVPEPGAGLLCLSGWLLWAVGSRARGER